MLTLSIFKKIFLGVAKFSKAYGNKTTTNITSNPSSWYGHAATE